MVNETITYQSINLKKNVRTLFPISYQNQTYRIASRNILLHYVSDHRISTTKIVCCKTFIRFILKHHKSVNLRQRD